MITLATQLLLAHLIGDFVLQPSKWVAEKNIFKWRSKYIYLHTAIHLILLLTMTGFSVKYVWTCILITISHLIIDIIKLQFQHKKNSSWWFFGDQIAHLTILAIAVHYYYPYTIEIQHYLQPKSLLLVTALVLVSFVSSVLMKVFLAPWTKTIQEDEEIESIPNTGKYIGMMERLFIFFSVITGFWQGVGFLLTAKSILRLGTSKDVKNMKLTEYILIGTFLSFGLGILIAVLYNYILPLI